MPTYEVTPQLAGWSPKRKRLRFVMSAGLFAALQVAVGALFPSLSSGNHWWLAGEAVLAGLMFAFVMTAFSERNLRYKVIVSDDSITAVHLWFRHSVQRKCVRSVVETRGNALTAPALRISKHGRFGMFLWGSVWIPRSLPEYESIRSLALNWKATT